MKKKKNYHDVKMIEIMTNSAGNAPVLNTGVAPSLVWHLKEAAMTWKRTSEDLAKCEANLKHSLHT